MAKRISFFMATCGFFLMICPLKAVHASKCNTVLQAHRNYPRYGFESLIDALSLLFRSQVEQSTESEFASISLEEWQILRLIAAEEFVDRGAEPLVQVLAPLVASLKSPLAQLKAIQLLEDMDERPPEASVEFKDLRSSPHTVRLYKKLSTIQ